MDKQRLMKLAGLLKEDFELPEESPFETSEKDKYIISATSRWIWTDEDMIKDTLEELCNTKKEKILSKEEFIKEYIEQIRNPYLEDPNSQDDENSLDDVEAAIKSMYKLANSTYSKDVDKVYKKYLDMFERFSLKEGGEDMDLSDFKNLVKSVTDDILSQNKGKGKKAKEDWEIEDEKKKKRIKQGEELAGLIHSLYNIRPNEGYASIADSDFRISFDRIKEIFNEEPLIRDEIQKAIKESSKEWKDRFTREKFVGNDDDKINLFLHMVWSKFLRNTKASDFKEFARLYTGKVGNIYLLIGVYVTKQNLFPFKLK